jgi:Aerotolerance regulator N-terminal/von Willebrand factor type A domain
VALMGFLAPVFLAGLVALSVPILVHLTHRPRSETVPFPSLMFLQRIPYRSSRRQTLRHWVLFALRCAAFILLALAFARPFFGTSSRATSGATGARTRIVLLDRSGSMAYGDRWPKGLEAARRAVEELGPEDRGSLVLFDAAAESTGEPTVDRSRLLSTLDSARVGFGGTRYGPALRMAAEMLEASTLPRLEVVLVTDFQKTGWDGRDDVRLPSGATLTWVDVSQGGASNVAITGVEFDRDYEAGRERVVAAARLVNKGARAVKDLEVALEIDGRPLRQERTSLGPNTSATVTFDAFPLPSALARATVRAAPDRLPHDDAFHVVLAPGGELRVLVLEDASAAARRSLYLRRALEIGHRPRFRVEVKPAAQFSPDELGGAAAVVLNDVAPPAAGAGRRLREFVEKGGGLLAVLGEQSAVAAWRGDAASLLPGLFGSAADRSSDRGGTLAYVDYAHPVFELFRGPRSGDFSSARFFRYRPLEAQEGVLARFDDGAVALAERKVGKGRILVWTSTLDTLWNDLPLQPVFLPFLHQLVKHAAAHVESRPWYTVGEALDLSAEAELSGRDAAVIAPSGEKQRLPAGQRGLELEAPGFYEVRRLEDGGWSRLAAVNFDPSESDLASLDPEELSGAVTQKGDGRAARRAEPAPTTEEHESRQALWRYLLVAALLFLALETVFSNRLSARVKGAGQFPPNVGI